MIFFLFQINADGTHSIVSMIFSAGKTLTGVGSLLSGAKVRVNKEYILEKNRIYRIHHIHVLPETVFRNDNISISLYYFGFLTFLRGI